jgi:hypothetical protein
LEYIKLIYLQKFTKIYKDKIGFLIMETFIKKVIEKKVDENAHIQFMKFSKGQFLDRAMVNIKKSGNKYNISTTQEYANDLVRELGERVKGITKVTGAIVSTQDLTGEIEFKDKKQFQGVKRYIIEKEMTKEEILHLGKKFPKAFLALSFKTDDSELKIKPKAPKSGKPSSKESNKPKVDFCKLKTTDKDIVKGFLFDIEKDFKNILISHDFLINDLKIPKDEKDPKLMREKTIRKGIIVRKISLDGNDSKKEIEFEA